MKKKIWISGAFAALLLLVGLMISRYVWLPDVITGRVIVLDSLTAANGDRLRLVQFFNGDGYLTEFIQTDQTGRRWGIVIDPDAKKAWSGRLAKTTDHSITVTIWNRAFNYDFVSHLMTGLRADPVVAYEIPRSTPVKPTK